MLSVALLRLPWILLLLVAGFLLSLFVWMLPRRVFFGAVRAWHRNLCRAVGVRVWYRGDAAPEPGELEPGTLVVANHISWLDVHVIAARWPVVFLAMSEVRRWPVIGWLAARSGTLFIQRGAGAAAAEREIGKALRSGCNVVLFPEARTGDGIRVRRFHGRLFQAALGQGRPIRPLAIRYMDRTGRADPRPSFAGTGLLQSLLRVLRGGPLHAEGTLFAPLPSGLSRREAAAVAERQVRAVVETDTPRGAARG